MAFDLDYLTLVGPDGNSKSGRMWKYFTEDAHTDMDTTSYFDGASDLLGVGDTIQVCVITSLAADPQVIAGAGTHVVLSNAAGIVDTGIVTTLAITDTD